MAAGADALLGEHDFRAFCRRPPGTAAGEPIRRRVLDARLAEDALGPGGLGPDARLLRFDIAAQSFCHQMVRSIVGTLVEVGRGRRRASDVTWLLSTGDRSQGATLAPPHGLCLVAWTTTTLIAPDPGRRRHRGFLAGACPGRSEHLA